MKTKVNLLKLLSVDNTKELNNLGKFLLQTVNFEKFISVTLCKTFIVISVICISPLTKVTLFIECLCNAVYSDNLYRLRILRLIELN